MPPNNHRNEESEEVVDYFNENEENIDPMDENLPVNDPLCISLTSQGIDSIKSKYLHWRLS